MDKSELASIIASAERLSLGYSFGDLATSRAKALNYYLGKPLGNEVEGRSQVISSDVFDVIEGMLPQLVKIFAATNTAVEFEPVGPEDEEQAKQATAACNYVFYKQNNGVLIMYTWFKDALIQKNGVVKYYWDEKTEVQKEEYEALTQVEFEKLVSDDNVEVVEHSAYEDPDAQELSPELMQQVQVMGLELPPKPQLHDLKVKITKKYQKVCIDPIPPEEFLVTPNHNSIDLDDCEFCEHRTRKTISELKQMGFTDDELKDIGDGDVDVKFTQEYQARHQFAEELTPDKQETVDPSMREVWVGEGYIRVDYDGDGIAELRRFIKAGNKILENEEADDVCFAAITPIVMPHRFMGLSMADVSIDFQTVNTTLWRQMLDNLYLTNNPRHAVLENQANLDDLLTSRPGGIVRERVPNAVRPLETPFVAGQAFPMLEYNDTRKENRTGVTRYNQGTDADSLNKTAHGVQLIQNASMQRLELVARMFAETGVKRLFRGIKKTLYKSGLRKLSLRLNGQYVDVDPQEWSTEWDMTVNVGLGTGNKDQQLVHLRGVAEMQLKTIEMGKGYMISDENWHSTISKTVENSGFQHVDAFVTDPRSVPEEKKKSPPPPELLKLQLDAQTNQAKLQSNDKHKAMDVQSAQSIEQMNASVQIRVAEIDAETKRQIALAQMQSDRELEELKIRSSAEVEIFKANKEAELKSAQFEHEKTIKAAELQQQAEVKNAEIQSAHALEDKRLAAKPKEPQT